MKIVSDSKTIDRNGMIGFWATLFNPIFFIASLWIILLLPEKTGWAIISFFLGIILFQIGNIFKRWGSGADLALNNTLDKLGDDYTLYHFSTPVSHLLVGPAGICILVARQTQGLINYSEKSRRWTLYRGGAIANLFGFLKEGIGRPGMEIVAENDALNRYIHKNWTGEEAPNIQSAVIFFDDQAIVEVENCPIPTMHIKDLRSFIRSLEKIHRISPSLQKDFNALFDSN